MTSVLETYMAANPIEVFNANRWDMWDGTIAAMFHQRAQWTPLMGYVDMTVEGSETTQTLATQVLPGHVNHNELPFRTQYVDPMYFDTREKKLTGLKQYGQKVMMHKQDKFLNMWRNGSMSTEQLLYQLARTQLGYSVVQEMELIARDAYIGNAVNKHFGPHGQYADFSEITRSPNDTFDIDVLKHIRGALSERVYDVQHQYGTYATPVPGRPGNIMVLTSPGVVSDIWNQQNDFMVDLTTLQDQRLLNGAKIEYQGFTFVEGDWGLTVLYNAGNIDKQVAITAAVNQGDGAPESPIDNVYYVGQNSANVKHYVQCSPFSAGDFHVGDKVSLHTERTTSWGITDGCDFLDGHTVVLTIASIDTNNYRLSFREPVTIAFSTDLGACSSLGGASPSPSISAHYGYITKAQHIHPVVFLVGRGAHVFAMTQKVTFHEPAPVDDFESVWRASWDMYGAPNLWEPDMYDIYFVAGSNYPRGQEVTY